MPQRHSVASLADLPPGTGRAFSVAGRMLALFNVEGRLFAIDNVCPHDGAPLAEGTVAGTTLTCPWHSAEFDLTSGQVLSPPATEDIRHFPVFVNNGMIEVEL
jgi:nitrite reductase/ring-hydroxylating ferredoxin subunit